MSTNRTSGHVILIQQSAAESHRFTSWWLHGASLGSDPPAARPALRAGATLTDPWICFASRGTTTWPRAHQRTSKTIKREHMSCGGNLKPRTKPPICSQVGGKPLVLLVFCPGDIICSPRTWTLTLLVTEPSEMISLLTSFTRHGCLMFLEKVRPHAAGCQKYWVGVRCTFLSSTLRCMTVIFLHFKANSAWALSRAPPPPPPRDVSVWNAHSSKLKSTFSRLKSVKQKLSNFPLSSLCLNREWGLFTHQTRTCSRGPEPPPLKHKLIKMYSQLQQFCVSAEDFFSKSFQMLHFMSQARKLDTLALGDPTSCEPWALSGHYWDTGIPVNQRGPEALSPLASFLQPPPPPLGPHLLSDLASVWFHAPAELQGRDAATPQNLSPPAKCSSGQDFKFRL